MRVVWVESSEDTRLLGWGLLEAKGHSCTAFGTVEAAEAYCNEPGAGIDVVIIDLHCGNGAGVVLAGRIARARPDVAITVTSGGIMKLPPDMPGSVKLLPKPMRTADFYAATAHLKREAL